MWGAQPGGSPTVCKLSQPSFTMAAPEKVARNFCKSGAFFFKRFIYVNVCECFVGTIYMSGTHRGPRKAMDPLKLELTVGCKPPVGPGTH